MRNTLVAVAAAVVMVSNAPTVLADEFDKKTTITVNENLLIPGRVLPPGKYVMKLANVTANRHVVQIFNENQDKLEATILAFNNYRLTPTSETVLQYWETPAGSPPALRAWFWPGDTFGQEFAYPKDMADILARENNNAKVPSYAATTASPTPEQLAQIEVRDMAPDEGGTQQQAGQQQVGRQQQQQPTQQAQVTPRPAVTQQPAARIPDVAPTPAVTPVGTPVAPGARNNTVLAQNETPRPANAISEDQPSDELPSTASYTPWALVLGIIALVAAFGVRKMNRV